MPPSRVQENIAVVRRLLDGMLTEDNIDHYDQLIDTDIRIHGPASSHEEHGLAKAKALDLALARAFHKRTMEIHDIFGCDDRVVVYWTCRVFHKGDYEGIAPSFSESVVSGISIYRVNQNKITEVWQAWDRLGLLEQIAQVRISPEPSSEQASYELLKALGMERHVDKAGLLSERERQCLRHLLDGKTAKETAVCLLISHRTVESYFENIKDKLDCGTKRELFRAAQILQKLGLL